MAGVDRDLDDFVFVSRNDVLDDGQDYLFSQLDDQGQLLPSSQNSSVTGPAPTESSMSLDRNSELGRRGISSEQLQLPADIAGQLGRGVTAIMANDEMVEVDFGIIQRALQLSPNLDFGGRPIGQHQHGLNEDQVVLQGYSQDSYMNSDSPAGSQQINHSVPIQFPSSQDSNADMMSVEPGLGSLSQEHNRTVPQFNSEELGHLG